MREQSDEGMPVCGRGCRCLRGGAHFSASAGGPRGTGGLRFGDRRSTENAIWLCADHGRLVGRPVSGSLFRLHQGRSRSLPVVPRDSRSRWACAAPLSG